MEMVVVLGLGTAAVAFLVYFEFSLLRDSSQPFVVCHVEYGLASIETLPETDEGALNEPLAEAAAA